MRTPTEEEHIRESVRNWCMESNLDPAELESILAMSAKRLPELHIATKAILQASINYLRDDIRVALLALGVVPKKSNLSFDLERLRPASEVPEVFNAARSRLWSATISCGQDMPDSNEPDELTFSEGISRLPIGFLRVLIDHGINGDNLDALFDAGVAPYGSYAAAEFYDGPPPAWFTARREREKREIAERHARWSAEREREADEYEQRRNEEELRQRPKYSGTSNLPPAFVAYAGGTFAYEHLEDVQDRLIADLAKIRAAGDATDTTSRREGLLDLTITNASTEDHRRTIAERIQKTLRTRTHEITERASELRGSELLPMLRLTVSITMKDAIERSQIGLTSMDDFEIHYVKGAEMNDILAKLEGLPSGVS
jgi:hypothetical protein